MVKRRKGITRQVVDMKIECPEHPTHDLTFSSHDDTALWVADLVESLISKRGYRVRLERYTVEVVQASDPQDDQVPF